MIQKGKQYWGSFADTPQILWTRLLGNPAGTVWSVGGTVQGKAVLMVHPRVRRRVGGGRKHSLEEQGLAWPWISFRRQHGHSWRLPVG